MAELPDFPRRNLNPSAEPWGRAVEGVFADLNRLLDTVDRRSASTASALARQQVIPGADGTIYRSNGIVVPPEGQQLIWTYGEDADGNPTELVTGRVEATPYTIYYGDSEDDSAGWYSALQLEPGSTLWRANGMAYGGFSAVVSLISGNEGTTQGNGGGGDQDSDPYPGYIPAAARFAVEFGEAANQTVDQTGSGLWDPTASRWAIRYLAGDLTPVNAGGTASYLSLIDGRFEVGYLASTDNGSDAGDFGFAFKDWMRAAATIDSNGDLVRTLTLGDGVVLEGWGSSGGGGGGGGGSLATAFKGQFGDDATGPFVRGDVVWIGTDLYVALHSVEDDSTPPYIDTDNWERVGLWQQTAAYSLANHVTQMAEWDSTVTYNYDDLVTHNGSLWVAINQGTNREPGSSPQWWRFVALTSSSGSGGVPQATHTAAGISRLATETEILADGTQADYDQIVVTAHILKYWAANSGVGSGGSGSSFDLTDAYKGDYATGLGPGTNESDLYPFVNGTVPPSLNPSGVVNEPHVSDHPELGTPPADGGLSADPPTAGPYMLQFGPLATNNGSSVHRSEEFTYDNGDGSPGSSVGFDFATDVRNGGFVVYVDGVETYRFEQGDTATIHQWDHVTVPVNHGTHDVSISAFTRGYTGSVYIDNLSFNNVQHHDVVPGTYHAGDAVRYQQQWWLATAATTNTDPADNGQWELIALLAAPEGYQPPAGTNVGDVLTWDGTEYEPAPIPSPLPATANDGDVLTWNSDSSAWDAEAPVQPSAASDTAAGVVRLATSAEATAGTDTSTAVTPAEMKAAIDAVPTGGGSGGGNGPLVVGPYNSLTMPGLWMETDNAGNFVQWWYDDHDGVGGSNTNGDVSFGPTNGLQIAGLWIQTDENLVPQMLVYDDGNH